MIKRIIDIILAMGGLILASPLFIFCILMTYWQLGRPIFFTQERLGKDGKIFKIWKFRTMKVNAQAYRPILSEVFQDVRQELIKSPVPKTSW